MPTVRATSPATPVRNNGSQFLPTPPNTDGPRRLSRGPSLVHDAHDRESDPRQTPGASASADENPFSMPGGNAISEANTRLNEHVYQRQRDEDTALIEELRQQYNQVLGQMNESERQREGYRKQLEDYEAQRLQRSREYQALQDQYQDTQQREAAMRVHADELEANIKRLVEEDAEILTFANRRIAEQAQDWVEERETNHTLLGTLNALPQMMQTFTASALQKIPGLW
ncbi:hypothetical protein C8Q80DRAFT_148960 [Daedaleopsis nitida]|nr:hypothetical protein C8Q80DRAFT_148960 [Daedaleopsis nitida]